MERNCLICNERFQVTKKNPKKKTCTASCAAKSRHINPGQKTLLDEGPVKPMNRPPWINPYGRGVKGKRADLDNLYVRSRWEANVARILNLLRESGEVEYWEYEPYTFEYPVKKGNKWYTPDFRVFFTDGSYMWIEVKGWMDKNSEVKLKRFARYYPDEPLWLIDSKYYKKLEKEYSDKVELWEKK